MRRGSRLTRAYESALEISFDDSDRFLFFSDCHRGDGSWADDFARNRNLFSHALRCSLREGYTYIEIGDGDELWENRQFEKIRSNYSSIFKLMREFYLKNRLFLIWGNHDKARKSTKTVERTLFHYYDEKRARTEPLFEGIELNESIILKYLPTGNTIFLVHGHQGDLLNDRLWWLARFLARSLWRPLQLLGARDPTRPAQNYNVRKKVERKILRWSGKRNQILVTGHTHRPRFAQPGDVPYFNDGCCVHPRSITGIEIANGTIQLIRWTLVTTEDGYLRIEKDTLAGPKSLRDYFTAGNAS